MSIISNKYIAISTLNSTTTPLGIGGNYTGTAEQDKTYTSIGISVATDQNGVLKVQFSENGTDWDTTLSFNYNTDRINPPHIFEHLGRYCRVQFDNDSGVAQTYLRLQTSFGNFQKLTSPVNGTLAETYDALSVRPTDFKYEVANGKRQGRKTINTFGYNLDIDTGSEEVVASFGGPINIMTTADTLDVVSTSTDDDAGGTGATLVQIIGIDADFNEIEEFVTMDGTTAVTTANSYLGVNRAFVIASGSSNVNVGDINITDTAGTVGIQSQIPAGSSVTQQCIYHTPINHNFLADWFKANVLKLSGGGGAPVVNIRGYSYSRVTGTNYEVLNIDLDTSLENTIELRPSQPFVIGGREVFYITAETDTNNTTAKIRFSGIQSRLS